MKVEVTEPGNTLFAGASVHISARIFFFFLQAGAVKGLTVTLTKTVTTTMDRFLARPVGTQAHFPGVLVEIAAKYFVQNPPTATPLSSVLIRLSCVVRPSPFLVCVCVCVDGGGGGEEMNCMCDRFQFPIGYLSSRADRLRCVLFCFVCHMQSRQSYSC